MSWRLGIFAAVAFMVACARSSQAPGSVDGSTTFVPPTPRVPVKLAPLRFDRGKVTFDGLADVTPEVTPWGVGGVFSQSRPLGSSDEALRILVRSSPDETLEAYLEAHPEHPAGSFSRAPTTVCGLPAEMVRSTRPGRHVACVQVVGGDNHPADIPPASVVVVAFSRPPLRTLFSVEVSASRPEDYAEDVERILASIRCP